MEVQKREPSAFQRNVIAFAQKTFYFQNFVFFVQENLIFQCAKFFLLNKNQALHIPSRTSSISSENRLALTRKYWKKFRIYSSNCEV